MIFSPSNSKIMLDFTKIKVEDSKTEASKLDPKCFIRKIMVGNCKIYSDAKLEKAVTYDIVMPREDKSNFFTCDKFKGIVAAGTQPEVISFIFKPPSGNETLVIL